MATKTKIVLKKSGSSEDTVSTYTDTKIDELLNDKANKDLATSQTDGLMSAQDKAKLIELANTTNPTPGEGLYIQNSGNTLNVYYASTDQLGGIKTGYTTDNSTRKYKVETDSNANAYVYVPWSDTQTVQATSTALGGIKIGHQISSQDYPVELDGDGKAYVNVPWEKGSDTTYLAGAGLSLDTSTNTFNLEKATSSIYGGIKIGGKNDDDNRDYAVKLDLYNNAYVHVPWENSTVIASLTALGGIKTGYSSNASNFGVRVDDDGNAYVAVAGISQDGVPIATQTTVGGLKIGYTESGLKRAVKIDTSTNMAYVDEALTAGNYISISGTTISLSDDIINTINSKSNGYSSSNKLSYQYVDGCVTTYDVNQTIYGYKTFDYGTTFSRGFTSQGTSYISTGELVVQSDANLRVGGNFMLTHANSSSTSPNPIVWANYSGSIPYAKLVPGSSSTSGSLMYYYKTSDTATTFTPCYVLTSANYSTFITDTITNLYAGTGISLSKSTSGNTSNYTISTSSDVVTTTGTQTITGRKTISDKLLFSSSAYADFSGSNFGLKFAGSSYYVTNIASGSFTISTGGSIANGGEKTGTFSISSASHGYGTWHVALVVSGVNCTHFTATLGSSSVSTSSNTVYLRNVSGSTSNGGTLTIHWVAVKYY